MENMNQKLKYVGISLIVGTLILMLLANGCGKSSSSSSGGSSANLPLISPPVKAATPAGFGGSAGVSANQVQSKVVSTHITHNRSLSSSDIKSRFFTSGPTSIFNILQTIDGLIKGVNSATGACITQDPVSYTITPMGQSVTMYAQCASKQTPSFSGDPGLFQFGVKSNLVYIYSAIGAEHVAAIITPLGANGVPLDVAIETPTVSVSPNPSASVSPNPQLSPLPDTYQVELWIAVGFNNSPAWDSGSYGIIHVTANTYNKTFEMAIAGGGFGYCGAQLRSDGTNVYIKGSVDMGQTCNAADTLCVLASDGTSSGTCGSAVTDFQLIPLGRTGGVTQTPQAANNNTSGLTYGASLYPGGVLNFITLDGTSTDALYFGPTTSTTGTGTIVFSPN